MDASSSLIYPRISVLRAAKGDLLLSHFAVWFYFFEINISARQGISRTKTHHTPSTDILLSCDSTQPVRIYYCSLQI
jgi:hypothetical protein